MAVRNKCSNVAITRGSMPLCAITINQCHKELVLTQLFYTCHWIHPINLDNTPRRFYHFPPSTQQEPETIEIKELAQGHTANGEAGLWPQQADSAHGLFPTTRYTHSRVLLLGRHSPLGEHNVSLRPWPFLSPGQGSISSICK